jgi:hypothetical protein
VELSTPGTPVRYLTRQLCFNNSTPDSIRLAPISLAHDFIPVKGG